MAGEVVTQTLNDAFGYDGWSMEVKDKSREVRLNFFPAFDVLFNSYSYMLILFLNTQRRRSL